VADTKPVHGFTPAAARLMLNYDWPGNVRELQNAVEAACSLTRFDHVTDLDLPARLRETRTPAPLLPLDDVERSHIGHVMQLADGNKAEAARMLGITRKTLYRKLKHHGLLHARQQIPSEPGLRDTPV
jgi:two-component system response regulator HydG